MIKCVLGLDPGASGAVAFYFPDVPTKISVYDIPLAAGEIDCAAFADLITQYQPDLAVVERVGAMPKQGVSSTFKFGVAYGMARGVIAAAKVPVHLITPAFWKKHFRLNAEKEQARALAIRLFPSNDSFRRKMDHGRAEAALIAKFGAETMI
jgi:crossover junction endodeoxyribonuclease RuvC